MANNPSPVAIERARKANHWLEVTRFEGPYPGVAAIKEAHRDIADALAFTPPAQPVAALADVGQRLQDHMEQFHGIALKASEWDAAARAALSGTGAA